MNGRHDGPFEMTLLDKTPGTRSVAKCSRLTTTGLTVNRSRWMRTGSRTGRLQVRPGSACIQGNARSSTRRRAPKQELDLFQFAATSVAQLSTGAAKVMRSKVIELDVGRAPPNHVPDDVFGQSSAPRGSVTADCSEEPTRCDFGGRRPAIHSGFHPSRHRHSPDVAALADQIYDGPSAPAVSASHAVLDRIISARRNPQPRSTEIIATSRTARNSSPSAACNKSLASSCVNQFPVREPNCFTPFTRRIPAASSGLSSSESAAS